METKKLAIWMDHASAHLMEYTSQPVETTVIESKFTHQVKEHSLSKSEKLAHNKEQHQEAEYYKQLGEVIKKYDDVLLYGPTQAKVELLNLLRADHHFKNIKIETKHADKMTVNQQHAFVREYFTEN
jgi:stalled ribosome rescue protein Dom34